MRGTPALLSTIQEPGGRTVTLTTSGRDLTGITNPDGSLRTLTYSSHRLTNDRWGVLNTTYSYNSTTGVLTGLDRGLSSTLSDSPASVQGLVTTTAKLDSAAVGVLTDAKSQLKTDTLDVLGRPIQKQTPDGARQSWQLDFAGQATAYTDPLNRTTTNIYQYGSSKGDLVQVTRADGSNEQYQYHPTFHYLTQRQDALGRLTTYSYDSTTGDLLTAKGRAWPGDHADLVGRAVADADRSA